MVTLGSGGSPPKRMAKEGEKKGEEMDLEHPIKPNGEQVGA
jgi:hypothetical protein